MGTSATNVIMPVLGMAQETGKIIRWLKAEGQTVTQGEPLLEVETDKATAEIEAPASGILSRVTAKEGDEVPVATVLAVILPAEAGMPAPVVASPVAARIAAEHHLDLTLVKPEGGRVEKADVLAYLERAEKAAPPLSREPGPARPPGRIPASPKARRLAAERGIDLTGLRGTGPGGAVQAADVLSWKPQPSVAQPALPPAITPPDVAVEMAALSLSRIGKIMAERTTTTWTTVPHFYLLRDVNASRLVAWREIVQKQSGEKITYTDLLLKLAAAALRKHPRIRASWADGALRLSEDVNIGLAVAVEDGLVVPVLRRVDRLSLSEVAAAREDMVERARTGKLRPEDLSGGTFTITNLGMYGVDVFNAILNGSQAAILAVGRIAERVVPVNGQPAVRPMMTLSVSFDHRVVDGARGAQFLETLADLIEEPLGLLS